MVGKKTSNIDRAWLVENRSNIQTRLLELDKVDDAMSKGGASHLDPFFNMMVGVAFSLWGAVFLIRTDYDRKSEHAHARELVGILIETNVVGFPQDQKTANWTSGYYINNAALRLYAMTSLREIKPLLLPANLKWQSANMRPNAVNSEASEFHDAIWEKVLEGFDRALKDLQARLRAARN
jgi:hypothetical protein